MDDEYHKALEIAPSASSQEIKQAYKKLALKYHPDKHKQRLDNTNMASINDQIILINEAYSVLAHEESRAQYDSLRSGKTSDHEECEIFKVFRLRRELFYEIMAKRQRIIELSESFTSFANSMGWINSENENKLFSEKEISSIESNIPEENMDTSISDYELITHYISDDDIMQIIEKSQWILIDKETLIHSEFVESHMLLIELVKMIVPSLMLACYHGTWLEEKKIDILRRVSTLISQIIQYFEFIIQKSETDEKEFESIIDKIKTENIRIINNLNTHSILSKISDGHFGRYSYTLRVGIAALLGPPSAGQSLYWSILALILLGIVMVHNNEVDLESFQQFLNLFEEIVLPLNDITIIQ